MSAVNEAFAHVDLLSAVDGAMNFIDLAGTVGMDDAKQMTDMFNEIESTLELHSAIDEAMSHVELMSAVNEAFSTVDLLSSVDEAMNFVAPTDVDEAGVQELLGEIDAFIAEMAPENDLLSAIDESFAHVELFGAINEALDHAELMSAVDEAFAHVDLLSAVDEAMTFIDTPKTSSTYLYVAGGLVLALGAAALGIKKNAFKDDDHFESLLN